MWFRNLLIGLQVFGVITTCASIGKPKTPNTPLDASVSVALAALLVWGILAYWP